MKRRSCLQAVVLLAAAAGCVAPPMRPGTPAPVSVAPRFVRVRVGDGARATVQTVPFEDYVRTAILSELAPAGGDPAAVARMLEVQAIVSRTYAFAHLRSAGSARHAREGFDLCATTHCQLFEPARLRTSRWAQAAEAAVRSTRGTVLWFDRRPAAALFHSDCGGHTSAASSVWGGADLPYLVAHADDGAAAAAHTTWRYEASREALARALNADARTRIGASLDSIAVLDRDDAGRARRVALRGERDREVRGEDLRDVLARAFGARSIRSTWFHVRREGSAIIFEGRGFGHGVGLCQAGALARIRAGAQPRAVLQRYFPGTRLLALR